MPIITLIEPRVPETVWPSLEPLIRKWLWLLPTWCQNVHIVWSNDSDGAILEMRSNYQYRHITLKICPLFLTRDQRIQEISLIHEFGHALTAPTREFIDDLIDELLPEEDGKPDKYRKLVLREWGEREESAVEDLANRIYEQFNRTTSVEAGASA